MTTRSRYVWRREGQFVLIEDRDLPGTRSVTNDIEAVIRDLYQLGIMLERFYVLYRDSDGISDQIIVRGHAFSHFHPLRARRLENAKQLVLVVDPDPPPRAA